MSERHWTLNKLLPKILQLTRAHVNSIFNIAMKVLTWNVNGIRASKVPLRDLLDSLDCDVICFQETKVTRDQLDETSCIVEGYNAYFSFSRKRSGYSGVATFCRNKATPIAAEEGLTGLLSSPSTNASAVGCYGDMSNFTEEELHSLDAEGRAVMTQHELRTTNGKLVDVVVINVYCPRADRENQERFHYKMRFYELLQLRAEYLVKAGRHVIVVGDINASHKPIDHCDPDIEKIFRLHPSRKWLDQFLYNPAKHPENIQLSSTKQKEKNTTINEPNGTADQLQLISGQFVDTFRYFHPDRRSAFTCWSTVTSARQTNYGTRIDYIFADRELCYQECVNCDIMPEVEGSDHCPVKAELKGVCKASSSHPSLCTKFMPEFAGKQQKLSNFFQKVSPSKRFVPGMLTEETSLNVNKKRGNTLHSSVANKNRKKQKTGPGSGSLLNFFQKKDSKSSHANAKPNMIDIVENRLDTMCTTCDNSNGKSAEQMMEDPPETSSSQETASGENSGNLPLSSSESTFLVKYDKNKLSADWKTLFKGPLPPPMCKGHKEPCIMRTVKKAGPNRGKRFFVCAKPEGHKSNPEARCDHFEWMGKT